MTEPMDLTEPQEGRIYAHSHTGHVACPATLSPNFLQNPAPFSFDDSLIRLYSTSHDPNSRVVPDFNSSSPRNGPGPTNQVPRMVTFPVHPQSLTNHYNFPVRRQDDRPHQTPPHMTTPSSQTLNHVVPSFTRRSPTHSLSLPNDNTNATAPQRSPSASLSYLSHLPSRLSFVTAQHDHSSGIHSRLNTPSPIVNFTSSTLQSPLLAPTGRVPISDLNAFASNSPGFGLVNSMHTNSSPPNYIPQKLSQNFPSSTPLQRYATPHDNLSPLYSITHMPQQHFITQLDGPQIQPYAFVVAPSISTLHTPLHSPYQPAPFHPPFQPFVPPAPTPPAPQVQQGPHPQLGHHAHQPHQGQLGPHPHLGHPYYAPQPQQIPQQVYMRLPPNPPSGSMNWMSLPSTKDMPKLTGRHDWGPWQLAAISMIGNLGVYGHIADTLRPAALYNPDLEPTYPPAIHPQSTQQEKDSHHNWWLDDGIAAHILQSRVAESIRTSLPYPDPTSGAKVTACKIWDRLQMLYSAGDYNSALAIEAKLRALACKASSSSVGLLVADYVAQWRSYTVQMSAAGYPLPQRQLLQLFADGLPRNMQTYTSLQENIYLSLNNPVDATLPSLEDLFLRVCIMDNVNQRLASSSLRPPPIPRQTRLQSNTLTNPNSSLAQPTNPRTPCATCGGAHSMATCFQPGGAMEGKRDEVLAAKKLKAQVMLAEIAEEEETPNEEPYMDLTVHEPVVALSLARPTSTESIAYSCCYNCPPMPSTLVLACIESPDELDWSLLAPLIAQYNTTLDSGCSIHLIKDKEWFWTYNEQEQMTIGTANCGHMETRARGEVRIRLSFLQDDGTTLNVTWILCNCMHAPDLPFNLISVGQLQEVGFRCHFDPPNLMFLRFPSDHPKLGTLSVQATIKHRISFFNLNFILPSTNTPIPSISAFPAYPVVELTPNLWHRRLGHPGMDTTRAVLTKDTVLGIEWTGHFDNTHCVPCILGKAPQQAFISQKKRADNVCDLVHMDTCGPFLVMTPHKQRYFFAMLDDASNTGEAGLLMLKSGAMVIWKKTKAHWENISGNRVKVVRVDGAKELVEGQMQKHFDEEGITMQQTAPYAHQQNGKAERYIRTICDTMLTLGADSGLPPSFWGYGVMTSKYLRNCIPTKTLSNNITPYKKLHGQKPDLSHLHVWGCKCFVYISEEVRGKGSPLRFEAIFIGYKEDRIGWMVCDLNGKLFFSRDVIFVESKPGHLSSPKNRASAPTAPPDPSAKRILHSNSDGKHISLLSEVVATCHEYAHFPIQNIQNFDSICTFLDFNIFNTFLTSSNNPNSPQSLLSSESSPLIPPFNSCSDSCSPPSFDNFVLGAFETDLDFTFEHSLLTVNRFSYRFRLQDYNPNKPPDSYNEAIARPDKDIWLAAMKREVDSLHHRGAFERITPIPKGRKAIGVRWTFAFKYHPDGSIWRGEEKARLVAQGFSQREGIDFGATYAPVVKPLSVRIILAWANQHDYEIMSFDVKTAFLHAKLSYSIYVKQIPGFPEADPQTVLHLLVALYGLRQSAYEFYTLLLKLLLCLGLSRCEVDHAVFIGHWSTPPHPSIQMPPNGEHLFLLVPVHVDDGLAVTNSLQLYLWFIQELLRDLEIIDMGPVSMYLGNRITRDRTKCKLWISQKPLVYDFLQNWEMLDCTPARIPMSQPLHKLPDAQPNALPNIADADITINFQRLVGTLIYLAVGTRPDIAYAAMALGQYNASPTRTHLLAAKGVLRYLAGTMDYGIEFSATMSSNIPEVVAPYVQGCALTDADWASDEKDRRSISGYCFYYCGCLVSWSASKQKVVASSSTEAEYYAMSYALREALWMRLFLTGLNLPIPKPFPLLCDNKSALCLANSDVNSSRSKHIDVRYHFIREKIEDGTFETSWIPTAEMTADIFTKPLPLPLFSKHRLSLGIVPIP